MRLTRTRYASPLEQEHAYHTDDAQALVSDPFGSGEPIDGMDDLHGDLMGHRDEDAIAQIESGEWLLVKDDAYYFDWGRFDKTAQEQKSAQRLKEIRKTPLPDKVVEKFVVRILDSVSGEPLANRKVRFVMGREERVRKTDSLGIAYISPAPAPQSLAILQLHLAD